MASGEGRVGWGQSGLWECSELGKGFNARLLSETLFSPFSATKALPWRVTMVTWASWLGDSTRTSPGHFHCLPQPRNSRRLLGSCPAVLLFGDGPWAGREGPRGRKTAILAPVGSRPPRCCPSVYLACLGALTGWPVVEPRWHGGRGHVVCSASF